MIISNGRHWEAILKKSGFTCHIKNGGSLRYTKLADSNQKKQFEAIPGRENHVLVLLSSSLGYSLDLLFYLIRYSLSEKTFLLRPHPDLPEKIIRKHIPSFPDHFSFNSEPFEEVMPRVAYCIHIGTTAAIECMMVGIKVMKYLPERIDMDPLLGLDIDQEIISDGDSLVFGNKVSLNVPLNEGLIAEPVNEETWKNVVNRC